MMVSCVCCRDALLCMLLALMRSDPNIKYIGCIHCKFIPFICQPARCVHIIYHVVYTHLSHIFAHIQTHFHSHPAHNLHACPHTTGAHILHTQWMDGFFMCA